jgi:adenylylsulfate kinase-like enzyme
VGRLIWITGLPGSGKTTLGDSLVKVFRESGETIVHLDGDQLRDAIKIPIGYDLNSRKLLARSYQSLSKLLIQQNFSVVVTTVSMFHEIHSSNRVLFQNYYEIFLDVELDFRIRSNRENLYSKSMNVPGASQTVELPRNPDLTLRVDEVLGRQDWLVQTVNFLESNKHDN